MKPLMLGVLATLALGAGSAKAGVTVFGGGLANACSVAAIAGKADAKSEAICTESLDNEALAPKERAATLVNRGVIKMRRKQWREATADFNRAEQIKPDIGEIYVNRGAARLGQHRYRESLADLDKGIALGCEELAKAYFNRALAYEGLDDAKAAYFDYLKAAELNPHWAAPREQLTRFKVEQRPASGNVLS